VTATIAPLLTDRQVAVLSAIRDYYREHGYAPSLRDIGALSGLDSPSSVRYQLGELERMGWIRRHPGRSRAIVVLNPATGGE
jgi:repressor LexA